MYNAFIPRRTCNTTLKGCSTFLCYSKETLATRLNTSPTAMGLTSGESGLPYFKAVRLPRYLVMEGALPEARRVITPIGAEN